MKLAKVADEMFTVYDRFWRERRLGLLTIRATQSRVLGLDPFTTSLGAGTPVTLQLPRVRTISISTTVAVPLGSR